MRNRIHNCTNPYQGGRKRVLCVCSAGLLRSPTTAWVLSNEPFGFNTRAVGCDVGHALVPIDKVLITWADEIVCMEKRHEDIVLSMVREFFADDVMEFRTPIHVLDTPDAYGFREDALVEIITEKCKEIYGS